MGNPKSDTSVLFAVTLTSMTRLAGSTGFTFMPESEEQKFALFAAEVDKRHVVPVIALDPSTFLFAEWSIKQDGHGGPSGLPPVGELMNIGSQLWGGMCWTVASE